MLDIIFTVLFGGLAVFVVLGFFYGVLLDGTKLLTKILATLLVLAIGIVPAAIITALDARATNELLTTKQATPKPAIYTPFNIDDYESDDEPEERIEDDWIPEFDFITTPDSSAFSRIGYCEELWELMLTFRTTGDYVYYAVPPEEWEGLVNADSRGGYFQQYIKGNYDYERLA